MVGMEEWLYRDLESGAFHRSFTPELADKLAALYSIPVEDILDDYTLFLHRDAVKGSELVRKFRRKAAVKCAAFQIPIEPFLHAHHGSDLFLQQVKTIAAPTQTVPWVRDVGVRVVHTVERLRLYGGAGACQSYL